MVSLAVLPLRAISEASARRRCCQVVLDTCPQHCHTWRWPQRPAAPRPTPGMMGAAMQWATIAEVFAVRMATMLWRRCARGCPDGPTRSG